MTSQNCCDTSYYRTPFNIQYQNLYCNLAQSADTNLQNVITSGYSYDRLYKPDIKENYCGCGFTKVYNNTPMAEYYTSNNRTTSRRLASGGDNGPCPTDYLRTPFNVAYQNLYSGLARNQTSTVREGFAAPQRSDLKNVKYFYNR